VSDPGFQFLAVDDAPASPVVLSVPHAGRDYPPALVAALRLPAGALAALEDRHLDAVAHLARRDETMLVQRRGRAWIDLNRAEDERDPRVDEAAPAIGAGTSAKVRAGLGLVPRRTGGTGDLWRRRFTAAEVEARINGDHRPYHDALAAALVAAHRRFGTAVLVDLHSMPSLGREGADVVIGDRFGRSAADRVVARALAAAAARGRRVAINSPYAGAHVLDRHGRPAAGVHAIQVELDRRLYLDARLDRPGPGLAATATLVADILAAVADEALATGAQIAAE
jgi:N-formylglutamate amidohydrolase